MTVFGAPKGRHDRPTPRGEVDPVGELNEVPAQLRHRHNSPGIQVKVGALIAKLARILLERRSAQAEIEGKSWRQLEVILNKRTQVL